MSRTLRRPGAAEPVATLPDRRGVLRFLPSARSLVAGMAVAAIALLVYLAARETSVFAVRSIEVHGVAPQLAAKVEDALQPLEGRSLLNVDAGTVSSLATALPGVAAVSYDRAFPGTLRVQVEPETPLAVVRRGVEAWLVADSGRVMARIPQRTHTALPRIWLPTSVDVQLGATLAPGGGAEEVAALAPVRNAGLPQPIARVRVYKGQYTYVLRGGFELRFGSPENLGLKLEVARRILAQTPVFGYLDVSVVERPVAGVDPKVSG
jgi:cell division protein FtsQ